MKWACIILLIIDLLLVGGAAFRFLTIPKAEVQVFVDQYEGNAAEINDVLSGNDNGRSLKKSKATEGQPSSSDESASLEPSTSEPTINEMIENKESIDMGDEDKLFNYDDQATKQEGLDNSKKKVRAVFRTSP